MGSSASKPSPLAPTFQRMDSWDIKSSRRLLADYKEKDLDFGLDAQGLAEIISGDNAWAETIIDAFGGTNGIVNVLAFISGAILVSSGAALEKANLVFDAMDFDMTEQISMDEMTIVLLCCARGYSVMSGTGKVPSDEELENVTLQAYRELSKSGGQSITKTEFTKWVMKYIAAASTAVAHTEVTLQDMTVQFGLEVAAVKSISEEVLQELAGENNTSASEEPAAEATAEAESDSGDQAGAQTGEEAELVAGATDLVTDEQPVECVVEQQEQAYEDHIDEQQQQHPNEEEYNEEFQQETPRIDAHEEQHEPTSAVEQNEVFETAPAQDEASTADLEPVVRGDQAPEVAVGVEESLATAAPHSGSEEVPSDVNAYDTYDYTQDAYDASSGLPPPDPFEEQPNAEDQSANAMEDGQGLAADGVPAATVAADSVSQEDGK